MERQPRVLSISSSTEIGLGLWSVSDIRRSVADRLPDGANGHDARRFLIHEGPNTGTTEFESLYLIMNWPWLLGIKLSICGAAGHA
jgi:hypothetical protein